MNTEELLSDWLKQYATTLPIGKGVVQIIRAEPRFQTRNFFDRFKVRVANLDGTGQNPTAINCFVVEVSMTNQSAAVASDRCDSIKDL